MARHPGVLTGMADANFAVAWLIETMCFDKRHKMEANRLLALQKRRATQNMRPRRAGYAFAWRISCGIHFA